MHLQDDSFLHREMWDFANTPEDNYPLLLHYHPLVIYRHQVIKQADVVLALFLLGDLEKAQEYIRCAALMDLADIGGNVRNGAHIASIGGTWLAVVYGYAGLRDYDSQLSFNPQVPEAVEGIRFVLTVRGQELEIDMERNAVTYLLRQGSELVITHQGQDITLSVGVLCAVPLTSSREGR
jgi:alpha,alpha-trehalose phosphorylase